MKHLIIYTNCIIALVLNHGGSKGMEIHSVSPCLPATVV